MKLLLLSFTAALAAGTALADIQDPPMNDQGPTRKLGRAISNLAFSGSELFTTLAEVNDMEGNAAAASYGLVKGVGRVLYRIRAGVYEFVTFPFPTHRRSFRPPYKSNIPWVHGGYEEFPPEISFQTRKRYSTSSAGY